jgi:hypothetical protein
MTSSLVSILLWLWSIQIDPFLLPVITLIVVSYRLDRWTTKETIGFLFLGLFGAYFLYAPSALAGLTQTNATAVMQLSFATRSLGLNVYGTTLAQTLLLNVPTLSAIIRFTHTREDKILLARRICFAGAVVLFVAYWLYIAGFLR